MAHPQDFGIPLKRAEASISKSLRRLLCVLFCTGLRYLELEYQVTVEPLKPSFHASEWRQATDPALTTHVMGLVKPTNAKPLLEIPCLSRVPIGLMFLVCQQI
jgi:hypothetical protein